MVSSKVIWTSPALAASVVDMTTVRVKTSPIVTVLVGGVTVKSACAITELVKLIKTQRSRKPNLLLKLENENNWFSIILGIPSFSGDSAVLNL